MVGCFIPKNTNEKLWTNIKESQLSQAKRRIREIKTSNQQAKGRRDQGIGKPTIQIK